MSYKEIAKKLIEKDGSFLYARKGQNKIFELQVDSVDAVIPLRDLGEFLAEEPPVHACSWKRINFNPEGKFKDYFPYGGWLWHKGNKYKDFRQSDLKPGEFLVESRLNFLKPPNDKEETDFGENRKGCQDVITVYWRVDNDNEIQVDTATCTFHRDGSVRLGGYSDGSGDFPSREEKPGHYALFEACGIEVVREARPVTAHDWECEKFHKMIKKHRPTQEAE